MKYMERKIMVDIGGFNFMYKWHEVIDRGFMFAMPWKLKSLHLSVPEFNIPLLQEGQQIRLSDLKTETEFTKPPDYLQESELISLMDQHGIGTDASIPQHMKNICDRHYVDVCGPGEDGQRGQVIQIRKHWGKKGGGGGGPPQQQQQRPTSRHMVPRPFGLAFLSCFEELDQELCDPKIRSFMEEQVG
ncbi:DNA topoisomerase 3-beta [Eurytemora carolleeae]|uniref:DNA topoisomerase 3-beta n=1 Tax=Eurytemora carolleeae TaxID=1294199 RepID=UPI000C76CD2D|nr:DNA topoisomerase 3-beta [Eurytemora carolleeae]|eukprot:XP_023347076.1 DNA topoisomerase 3-beta-like [Eurytemora affinis]